MTDRPVTTIFRLRLWLATYLGFYRYEGCWSMSRMPKARVLYPDGERSAPMAIGNAVEYRNMFGGKGGYAMTTEMMKKNDEDRRLMDLAQKQESFAKRWEPRDGREADEFRMELNYLVHSIYREALGTPD